MRIVRLSLVGTAIFILLGAAGAIAVSAQDTSQPFDGLFLGSCHFPFSDACEAGVRTTCDGDGQTTFGRANIHTEHCPQTTGPSSTDGELGLLFEDGSTLTATYAVTCGPLMPEGPGLVTCGPYAGELTGGSGRFVGATGSIGFDPVFGYFDGVDWPMVDWDWVAIPRGTVDVAAAPADE
jgi:hypothetical protein